MALELITLRLHSIQLEGVISVTMTADLKLMGLLSERQSLELYCIASKDSDVLKLSEINSYKWQKYVINDGCYKILCISVKYEIFSYEVIMHSGSRISLSSPIKWCTEAVFENFLSSLKGVKDLKPTEILAYEDKEAIVCYNSRFIVTFFLSSSESPQITSFLDVCESTIPTRKISLMKEVIFVLNSTGTTLSAYSISNNSKLLEVDLTRSKLGSDEIGVVDNFAVSLEKDVIVLHTEFSYTYFMALNRACGSALSLMKDTSSSSATATVTAFTKQFPSVQPVYEGLRSPSLTSITGFLQPMKLASDTENMKLEYTALYNEKLCFLFSDNAHTLIGIHQLGSETTTSVRRLDGPAFIVHSNFEPFPLILLLEESLSLLLYDTEHNKLINELMIYQCSRTAESLSHLNNWQNISIDIEGLKQGLRNRQLDDIKFFLKTHEERFRQMLSQKSSESTVFELRSERLSWTEVMDILLTTINSMSSDYHAHQFVKELLRIATSFLIQLLDDINQTVTKAENEDIIREKKHASLFFSKCLRQLREMLIGDTNSDISDDEAIIRSGKNDDIYSFQILNQWTEWDKKFNWKEVVEESLLKGNIAMAQSYFLNHQDISKQIHGNFAEFLKVGLELVAGYLKQRCITDAVAVLSNLGIPVNEKLVDIFQQTCEHDTRQILMPELESHNLLSEVDRKSFHFISIVQKLYPCASFSHAKQLQDERGIVLEDWYKCAFQEVETGELTVGDFIEPSWNNCETGAYCRLILNWLTTWDNSIRERVLLPQFLKGLCDFDLEISPISAWNYLLEYGDTSLIFKWISDWRSCLPMQLSSEFPYCWKISASMVNCINNTAPFHVAESILNELARFGIFCDKEQEDICAFLSRAGKAGCDLNNPTVFSSDFATLSFSDLCHKLVHYCLDHDLNGFLFKFLIEHYHRFISWPVCDTCDNPLLKMAESFCGWSRNIEESSLALNAMLATAEQIYNIPKLTTKMLLTEIPTPLNIAILLFSSEPLCDIIKQGFSSEREILELKSAVSSYPLLVESLLECRGEKQLPEVSVYQLLQGNSVFDPARLFGWQSVNVLRGDEALSELPHFLMAELSDQYGLKETFTHFYYLIEGRPNFAYLKLIAQEITSGNQISLQRVRLHCRQVFSFALSNFKDEKVCSSCLMFMELLGQDSLPLRTCLINANMLYADLCQRCDSDDLRSKIFKEICLLFQNALEDKDAANKVIDLLAAGVMQKVHSAESKSVFEDIILWMPVVTLAHFYNVTVAESYLCECAKLNDWLRLLVFCQVFQLPKDQVLRILPKFSNPCIGNHLSKALETKKSLVRGVSYQVTKFQFQKRKDLRQSLYTRIGLKREAPISPESSNIVAEEDEEEENISMCSLETSNSSDNDAGSVVIMKDLLMQLLQSHNSDAPWIMLLRTSLMLRNPVLCVLAASYPESDILCCFTIWLATAMPKTFDHDDRNVENTLSTLMSWTEDDLEGHIVEAVRKRKFLLLLHGVSIFMPDSPLLLLMHYLVYFLVYKKFDFSRQYLKEFQKCVADCQDNEPTSFNSLAWIEKISSAVLKEAVISCHTCYERQLFLDHLSSEKLFKKCTSAPDFSKLYNIIQCLSDAQDVNNIMSFMLPQSSMTYKNACWQSVKTLLQLHRYADAEHFASLVGLPSEEFFLTQVKHECEGVQETAEWSCLMNRIAFWKKVLEKSINQKKLKPQCIIEFIKNKSENADRYGEKCFLMQLILQHYKQSTEGIDVSEISVFTRKMWWWLIKEVETEQLSPEEFDTLLPPERVFMSHETIQGNETLSEKETRALEKIIHCLLAKKDLNQAFEVTKLFNHACHDLKVIQLCLSLARKEIDPNAVNIDEMAINTSYCLRKKSVVSWTSFANDPNSSQMEIINMMQKLCEKTNVAACICEQILVIYTVATVLNCSFDDIYKELDPFIILKDILSTKYKEKFALARSLIIVYDLKDDDIAKFLSIEIHSSIQVMAESAVLLPENIMSAEDDIIYNPASTDESFQLTVKLCQDSSLLGKKLMDILSATFCDFELNANSQSLFVMVELCICAHNCFTAACNVEGISQVLHKSKKVVALLAESKKFSLMVSLLTGIGRYSEMKYVFEKLHEHNQIESQLLKRKLRKVPHLRLALLDYLKCCPSSDNYYSALVHSFNMEREIAEDREISARKSLTVFCKSNSDPDLKKKLQDVMKDLVIAAENYCQADCLLQAQLCAELVNLVALQVHLFDTGVWIIGLDDMTVARYITELNEFSEALIIAEAYKHHQSWNKAIFHNVILRGNRDYFLDFQSHMGVSDSLIEDVAKTYSLLQSKTEIQMKNMKWLLSCCKNTELKYELAEQLGFVDVIQELNMGENAAFLQDLIATSSRAYT